MSTEDPNVPRRRSSAANRRRRKRGQTGAAPQLQETVQQGSVVTEEAATPEQLARHAQRREERRAAKARSEKRGVARVVNSERFSGSRAFYNDASSEIRKVIWPDRMQTRNLTLLVIALSIVMGVLLGGIDWTLLQLFEAIG